MPGGKTTLQWSEQQSRFFKRLHLATALVTTELFPIISTALRMAIIIRSLLDHCSIAIEMM